MDSQEIYNLIVDCYKHHPAYTMPFDKLYAGLMAEVESGNVTKQTDISGQLEMFSYTIDCQFGGKWNIFSLMSRGLILCPSKKQIIAAGFVKFFNYGEGGFYLPAEKFSVTQKYDGSCGFIWYYNGSWHVSTRGSFVSEQAQWGQKWLDTYVDKSKLIPGYTYICEIIYRDNKIVIPYDFEGLVLLSVFTDHGVELSYDVISQIACESKFACVAKREYYRSINDIVKVCENLPANQEGFVVRFESGYRLKIKGLEYLRVHKILCNVTPLCIWGAMIAGDNLDLIRKEIPEEIRKDFDSIVSIFAVKKELFIEKVKTAYEATKHLSDKELGLALKNGLGYDKDVCNALFLVRKKDLLKQVEIGNSACRKYVFGTFKPKGNKLLGYVPSTSINRFMEDKA